MKTTIAVVCLALMPCAWGQDEQEEQARVKTAREVQADVFSELRGTRENAYTPAFGWPDSSRIEVPGPRMFLTIPPAPRPKTEVGTVSAPALLHKVPKAAKKAYDRGLAAVRKNDAAKALTEWQKAVTLDPGFAVAHNDLGVLYMALGRQADAEAELRRAIELDPYVSAMQSNLGWSLLNQQKYPEAEQAARRALSLERNNADAKSLLGVLLTASLRSAHEQ